MMHPFLFLVMHQEQHLLPEKKKPFHISSGTALNFEEFCSGNILYSRTSVEMNFNFNKATAASSSPVGRSGFPDHS
jgi:hypothetical protein